MANRKTLDEQIESAKEKIKQEENRLKQYLQKEKEQKHKARTHRLIGRGAILESMIVHQRANPNAPEKHIWHALRP